MYPEQVSDSKTRVKCMLLAKFMYNEGRNPPGGGSDPTVKMSGPGSGTLSGKETNMSVTWLHLTQKRY